MSRLLALFLVALAFIGFLATTSYRVPAQNDRRWTKPPRSIERETGSPRGVFNGDVRRPSSRIAPADARQLSQTARSPSTLRSTVEQAMLVYPQTFFLH